jgi:hypothetical protein
MRSRTAAGGAPRPMREPGALALPLLAAPGAVLLLGAPPAAEPEALRCSAAMRSDSVLLPDGGPRRGAGEGASDGLFLCRAGVSECGGGGEEGTRT